MGKKIRASAHMATIAEGQTVYHTLRWCNRIRREFWFTLDPHAVDGESRSGKGERGAMDNHFDARTLPEKYRLPSAPPIQWIEQALRDGFDVGSITLKNKPPPKQYMASGLVVPPLDNGTNDFPF
jgi:hypothetical protein